MTEVHVVERKIDTIRDALMEYLPEIARKDLRPRSIRVDYTVWQGYDQQGRLLGKKYDYTYASLTNTRELAEWLVDALRDQITNDEFFLATAKIRGIRKYKKILELSVPDNAKDFVIIKTWRL